MSLVPWRTLETLRNPLREMEEMLDDMNRYFSPFSGWPQERLGLLEAHWSPAVDILDSKENILVKADIPGVKKEDLEVNVHNSTLVIKGEKKHETETKEEGHVRKERYYGYFNRAISLPSEVDANNVKATYKNGVLELVLPKKEEAKAKQIKVDVK